MCRISEWPLVQYAANPPPVVSGAPLIAENFLSTIRLSLRTNNVLDCRQIWQDVVYICDDSSQISRQSNVPFSSADRYIHATHHPLFLHHDHRTSAGEEGRGLGGSGGVKSNVCRLDLSRVSHLVAGVDGVLHWK